MSKRKEIDKAIGHLMDWADRPEWEEFKTEVFESHTVVAADRLGIDIEDLVDDLMSNGLSGMMFGFCFEDLASRRFSPGDGNLTEDFLKRRGWREGVHGRRYLRQLSESVVSLYEVIECVQGSYCDLQDLVRGGKPVRVYEQAGTANMVKWDHIAARVLPGDGKRIFSGAVMPISPESSQLLRDMLDKARKHIKESFSRPGVDDASSTQDAIEMEVLKYSAPAFSQVWLMHVMERLHAPLPEMVTRDGEPLVFTETRFDFDQSNRQEIVKLLDQAHDWEREDEDELSWVWLSGDPAEPGEMVNLNGFLEMTELDLRLQVNSMNRVEKGKAALTGLLGGRVNPTLTNMVTPEQMLDDTGPFKQGEQGMAPGGSDIDPADLAALKAQHLDQHYRNSLDEPIPMLEDATPRNCVKTKRGRMMVIEWLKYLENQESRMALKVGAKPYDFTWIWKELGLDRPT